MQVKLALQTNNIRDDVTHQAEVLIGFRTLSIHSEIIELSFESASHFKAEIWDNF